MNWLKRLLNGALNGFKADIYRELDRAIGKIENGESVAIAVDWLHAVVAELLAKTRLPMPLGAIVTSLLLMVDWNGMAGKPAADAVAELGRLRKRIEGARL